MEVVRLDGGDFRLTISGGGGPTVNLNLSAAQTSELRRLLSQPEEPRNETENCSTRYCYGGKGHDGDCNPRPPPQPEEEPGRECLECLAMVERGSTTLDAHTCGRNAVVRYSALAEAKRGSGGQ